MNISSLVYMCICTRDFIYQNKETTVRLVYICHQVFYLVHTSRPSSTKPNKSRELRLNQQQLIVRLDASKYQSHEGASKLSFVLLKVEITQTIENSR